MQLGYSLCEVYAYWTGFNIVIMPFAGYYFFRLAMCHWPVISLAHTINSNVAAVKIYIFA